jgi:hypothetical protein
MNTKLSETQSSISKDNTGKEPSDDDEFTQDMELDEQTHGVSHVDRAEKARANDNVFQYDQLMNEAMLYGQELQREYRDEGGDYAKTLQDIFSLVAYNDPKGSVHGHLLDPSGRVTVAEELNSAILGKSLTSSCVMIC